MKNGETKQVIKKNKEKKMTNETKMLGCSARQTYRARSRH